MSTAFLCGRSVCLALVACGGVRYAAGACLCVRFVVGFVMTQPLFSSSASESATAIPKRLPSVTFDKVVFLMYEFLGDLQVHCVMDVEEPLDLLRMRRAIRLTMDAEPVLGCRFVASAWRPHWERREDLDTLELCDLLETKDRDGDLDRYLCRPTDPCVEPIVQARIFRHDQGDTLCLKVHHINADGGALKQYASLLARAYKKLADNPAFVLPVNLHGRREIDQVLERFGWRDFFPRLRRAWRDLSQRFWPPRNLRLPFRARLPNTERTYILRHFSPQEVAVLQRYARLHDATMNDMLMTAYLRAWYRVLAPTDPRLPLRVMATVDLRRYLPSRQAEALCNLSNFFGAKLPSHEDITGDFSRTLAVIHKQVEEQKQSYIGAGDILLMIPLLRYLPYALSRMVFRYTFRLVDALLPPTMTNLGHIEPAALDLGGPTVRNAFLTASVIYAPHFAPAISGYDQQLTISAGICSEIVDPTLVQRILQEMFSEILADVPAFEGAPAPSLRGAD